MKNPIHSDPSSLLRVLLAGRPGVASLALADWLGEQGVAVAGPAATTAETLAVAVTFRPDVLLLDFHGLPVTLGAAVLLFKELAPALAVFVLTHEAGDAVRRSCRAAGVDAVFHKTGELGQLAAALDVVRLRRDSGSSLQPVSTSVL